MLVEQIIEIELRGPEPPSRTYTTNTGLDIFVTKHISPRQILE